jgi:hypothetical protein
VIAEKAHAGLDRTLQQITETAIADVPFHEYPLHASGQGEYGGGNKRIL